MKQLIILMLVLMKTQSFTVEETRSSDHFTLLTQENPGVSFSDQAYYDAQASPSGVNISEMKTLTIKGQSSPESELFLKSIQSLYAAFSHLQSKYSKEGSSFDLMPMEAYWWVESDIPFEEVPRDEWYWKIMLPLPDFVIEKSLESIRSALSGTFRIEELEIDTLPEEKAVQIMHIGSYDAEGPTIEKLMSFVENEGLTIAGPHHEIYLDDPNTTSVDQLKTIIRYAVQ